MKFLKLFIFKLVVYTLCFDFVYSQNPLNDPRFKEVLNQSGLSIERKQKEFLGKSENADFFDEKNISKPDKNNTSDNVKEQLQAIRKQDKSNEFENLNIGSTDTEKSSNAVKAVIDQNP